MSQPITLPPGSKFNLADFDAGHFDERYDKESAKHKIRENAKALADLGYRLYAEDRRSLLLVLQGMDTAGKDGTIRSVMRGFNPQSCRVTSFKRPSSEELDHDFLWRIHKAAPRRGNVGIFNRSQYEDVLVVRVHSLVDEREWRSRYELINSFEKLLVEGDTTIIKCFLYVSFEEQRQRLRKRIDNPHKRWKFRKGDLDERKLWSNYIAAYEDALTKCNTSHAPWYVIPSDHKWYRNLLVSNILLDTLREMNPQFPPPEDDLDGLNVE